MLSDSNFLILDEPTNHLDILSKEILEDAINAYSGTVLYVSHDRYFINRTAHRILNLRENDLTNYLGNYDYYLEKAGEANSRPVFVTGTSSVTVDTSENKRNWQKQREEQAKERKRANELKKCEELIEKLERSNQEIDEQMALPEICRDVAKLTSLTRRKQDNEDELAKLYDKWEELSQ